MDRELARRIAVRHFDCEPRIEDIPGHNHMVLRLRFPGESRVLKLAHLDNPASLRKEVEVVRLLAGAGIPAATVELADLDGSEFGRPFVVMRDAGGRSVADWVNRPGPVADALFREMGVVLARIHGIEPGQGATERPSQLWNRDAAADRRTLSEIARWAAGQGLLAEPEAEAFGRLDFPTVEGRALCHGDFHAVQCVVEDGRISAVVDWESAWAGNPTIDLAVAHAYLDHYCPRDLVRRFLDGYHSGRPLPADYDDAYLPVRMAQALALLRVWHGMGIASNVRRAVEVFRTYAAAREGRPAP